MRTPSSIIAIVLVAGLACSDTPDTSPGDAPAPRDEPRPAAVRPPSLTCGIDHAAVLSGDGIGHLRVGATVSGLRAQCRILRDSVVPFREGTPERVLLVDLGRDTVEALIENDRVSLLFTNSPAFRAAGDLGVGSTIADLRATGRGTLSREEGTHVRLRERCGLVFYLGPMRARVRATLSELPADGAVERVVVAGCSPDRRYYAP